MGGIGYVVKLLFIPINNIILSWFCDLILLSYLSWETGMEEKWAASWSLLKWWDKLRKSGVGSIESVQRQGSHSQVEFLPTLELAVVFHEQLPFYFVLAMYWILLLGGRGRVIAAHYFHLLFPEVGNLIEKLFVVDDLDRFGVDSTDTQGIWLAVKGLLYLLGFWSGG